MNTPFFPAFRSRLAAMGRRTVHSLRQATLGQLQDQARLRLPKERLEKALEATAQTADRRVGQSPQLQGRPVKVVDGSSTQLADTPANQKNTLSPVRKSSVAASPC